MVFEWHFRKFCLYKDDNFIQPKEAKFLIEKENAIEFHSKKRLKFLESYKIKHIKYKQNLIQKIKKKTCIFKRQKR